MFEAQTHEPYSVLQGTCHERHRSQVNWDLPAEALHKPQHNLQHEDSDGQ
jgi:hypothetical protein